MMSAGGHLITLFLNFFFYVNIHTDTYQFFFLDHWPLEKIRDPVYQQASFWISVLEVIDADIQMTFKYNIPKIMENLLLFCGNVSSFIRKVKGLHVQSKMIKKTKIFRFSLMSLLTFQKKQTQELNVKSMKLQKSGQKIQGK